MVKYALVLLLAGCELFVSVPNGQLASSGDDDQPDGGSITPGCNQTCAAPTPVCDTSLGSCVECVVSSDCTSAAAPNCDLNVCRGCLHDSECPASNTCSPDGTCADPSRILYASPDGTAATCDATAPCSIDTAIGLVSTTQDIIHLAAGNYPRAAMTTLTKTTTFAGEGAVMVGTAGTLGLMWYVMNGSAMSFWNIDMELGGMFMGECDGNGALALYATKVKNGAGIYVNACTVTVDRSTIDGNGLYAFTLASSQIAITNSFITNNGNGLMSGNMMFNGSGAIVMNGGVTGAIDHTTFSGNTGMQASIGHTLHCTDASVAITNSISYGNAAPTIDAACDVSHSLVDPDYTGGAGNASLDPMFVDPANHDYHIRPGSPAVMFSDPASLLAHDVDGQRRPDPAGTASDAGADEIP